jgi:hypothetical protein
MERHPDDLDDLLDRWLKAEDEGSAAKAEAALTALFAALPARSPAPGFADRVLTAAIPIRPRPAAWRRRPADTALLPAFVASPWGRAGIALGLAAAALGLPFLGSALGTLFAALNLTLVAPALARALTEVGGVLLSGLRFGRWLADFARTLLTPLESPAVATAMGACLLVSALALRLLHDLIDRERNWTHANPV